MGCKYAMDKMEAYSLKQKQCMVQCFILYSVSEHYLDIVKAMHFILRYE